MKRQLTFIVVVVLMLAMAAAATAAPKAKVVPAAMAVFPDDGGGYVAVLTMAQPAGLTMAVVEYPTVAYETKDIGLNELVRFLRSLHVRWGEIDRIMSSVWDEELQQYRMSDAARGKPPCEDAVPQHQLQTLTFPLHSPIELVQLLEYSHGRPCRALTLSPLFPLRLPSSELISKFRVVVECETRSGGLLGWFSANARARGRRALHHTFGD